MVAFSLALMATRLLNKQYVARLTYFDFTLGVILGAMVGHIPNDYQQPFLPTVIPLLILTGFGIIIGWIAMRFQKARYLLQGEPTVVIENGKLLDDNMRRLRYNLDQLNSQLRISGAFQIDHVEFAILEPGGQLSVLLKSQHRPVTPADLKLATKYEGLPIELIMDGQVVVKNLHENGLSEDWLEERLTERSIFSPSQVNYAVLDTQGRLFIDLFEDQIHRPTDVEGKNPSTPPSPSILP